MTTNESILMDGAFGTVPDKTVQCDGCGRDIEPGQKIHFHPHGLECMSCHRQRFSWFYAPRHPSSWMCILVGIGVFAILLGGLLMLVRILGL